ncbi:ABC transporter ATP-binding protein [Pseudomonas sp. PB120]|uniref:ABC transporter ATP-binding protein n=1 Tax=Pseudomonas sp. PB120 TaxID=2494700 RepID=UPI0012FDF981|nr:ATP-binding cassette domain-containing protein [Pseudomonas sp. PB120]MVV50787.1 ABC transporter ATP-binding protein [Pseudomonas sp. PB120]
MPDEHNPQANPLLRLRGIEVSYGFGARKKRVLHSIDFDVFAGETIGLIGETGSGKTTLVRSILGAVPVSAGSIDFAQVQISALKGRALRDFRRTGRLQYVFQDPLQSLDPDLSVSDSVAEGLHIQGKLNHGQINERVAAALHSVGLDAAIAQRNPRALSGGQRQRVVIARALVLEPALLLLDEPVSALDSASRVQMLRLLKTLGRERGIAQVFVSHDLGSVAGIADRIAVLYQGRIVESGPTMQVLRHPQHPYTQLLVGSAPTLTSGAADRARRHELREALANNA